MTELTDAELLHIHDRIWHDQTDDSLRPEDVHIMIGRAIANAAVARFRESEVALAAPPAAAPVRVAVRAADDAPVEGEMARSRWSSSGAVWVITGVEKIGRAHGAPRYSLELRSATSGRRSSRWAHDMVIVEAQ